MGTTNKNLELPAYNSTNWNTPLNSNFQIIDNTLGNTTTVNVGSADAILTYSDVQAMQLYVTGNIAANNRIITIPAGVGGDWIVTNATTYSTGSVTVKSAAGGTGVVLNPGGSAILYSNGSEIYSATSGATGSYLPLTGGTVSGPLTVQSSFGVSSSSQFNGPVQLAGGATIPVGQFLNIYGGINFPPSSSLALGTLSVGGASIGGNAIAVNGTSSFTGNVTLPGGNVTLTTGSIQVSNGSAANSFNGTSSFQNVNITGTLTAATFNPANISLTGQLAVNGAGANSINGTTTIPSGAKIIMASGSTLDLSANPVTISLGSNAISTGGAISTTGAGTITSATSISAGTTISATGQLSGGSITTAGNLTVASSYGITSGGAVTGSSINVGSGTATCGALNASGIVTVTNTSGIVLNSSSPNISWKYNGSNTFGTYASGTLFTISNTAATNYMTLSATAASGISVTGAYNNVSDISMKENIADIQDALATIKKLRGVFFDWIGVDKDKKNVGFIAQEVNNVLPEVVSETDDGKLTVAYSSIVPVVVNAIKELEKRVIALEAKL